MAASINVSKEAFKELDVTPNRCQPVLYLSGSPTSLWLQLGGHHAEFIEMMQQQIFNYGCQATAIENSFEKPTVNRLYCVKWFEDGSFYRGLVKSEEKDGSYIILYVDYGNMDVVTSSHIYPLPKQYEYVPHQAVHCCVKGFEFASQTTGPLAPKNQKMFENLFVSRNSVEAIFERNIRSATDKDAPKWVVSLLSVIDIGHFINEAGIFSKSNAIEDGPKLPAKNDSMVDGKVRDNDRKSGESMASTVIGNAQADEEDRPPSPIHPEKLKESKTKVEEWFKGMKPCDVVMMSEKGSSVKGRATKMRGAESCLSSDIESDFKSVVSSGYMSVAIENTFELKIEAQKLDANQEERFVFNFTHVENSNKFYIRLAADEKRMANLNAAMNNHFSKISKPQKLTLKVTPGCFVAAHFRTKKPTLLNRPTIDVPLSGWYRVEVVALNDNKVTVFLIDHGLKTDLSLDDIQPLPKKFFGRHLPRFAIPCYFEKLSIIKEDIAYQLLMTIAEKRFESPSFEEFEFLISEEDANESPMPVNIFLWFKAPGNNPSYTEDNGNVLNDMLVTSGLATRISTDETMVEDEGRDGKPGTSSYDPNFNPMEEDYYGRLPQFPNPLADGGHTNLRKSQRPCKFFRFNGKCHSGDNCEFSHVFTGESYNVDPMEKVNVIMNHNVAPPPIGSVLILDITCVRHPGMFFAVMPYGNLNYKNGTSGRTLDQQYHDSNTDDARINLASLQMAMTQYYKNNNTSSGRILTGEVVAVRYSEDNRWYRARVVNVSETRTSNDTMVDVFFVDFGNSYTCTLADIRVLNKDDFKHLKFQALECNLYDVAPLSGQTNYSMASGERLHSLINKKRLMAKVTDVSLNDNVTVDLYFEGRDGSKISVAGTLVQQGLVSRAKLSSRNSRSRPTVQRLCFPG